MLGIYPRTQDLEDPTGMLTIVLAIAADFKYSYDDKTFAFRRLRKLYDHSNPPPPSGTDPVEYYESEEVRLPVTDTFLIQNAPSMVLVSRGAGRYPDVRERAQEQKAKLDESGGVSIPGEIELTPSEALIFKVRQAWTPPSV